MSTTEEWLKIRDGDVLRMPSGRLRVARKVSYSKNNRQDDIRRIHVHFTIAHPSWTGRPYTVYNCGELRDLGYEIVGKRVRLSSQFDKLFDGDIGIQPRDQQTFSPADVAGIG